LIAASLIDESWSSSTTLACLIIVQGCVFCSRDMTIPVEISSDFNAILIHGFKYHSMEGFTNYTHMLS
jgi:hypothetical protein